MLTAVQHRQLVERMSSFVGFSPIPSQLEALVGLDLARQAPPRNGYGVAEWLLTAVLNRPDPALFIQIVTVADSGGLFPDLHDMVAALRTDPAGWRSAGPGDELWVPDPPPRPFVDREPRPVLQKMIDGHGPAVIVVDAPSGQGKRTLCRYVQQRAHRAQTFVAVVEDDLRAERDQGLLERIDYDLRDALGIDQAVLTQEEPERVGKFLASDLVNRVALARPSKPVWLVANLADPALNPGLLSYFDELLRLLPGADVPVRLVLLADEFSRFPLTNLPTQRYTLPDVDKSAIRAWFAATVPDRKPQHYDVAAGVVLQDLNAWPPADRMQWLPRICLKYQKRMLEAV